MIMPIGMETHIHLSIGRGENENACSSQQGGIN